VRRGEYREAVVDAETAVDRDTTTWRIAYNAARIYALAAAAASLQARKNGPDTVRLVSRYQDRAVELVRSALLRAPAEQRANLLRETIMADPALKPLERRLRALAAPGLD
jgi:hypothetical protein